MSVKTGERMNQNDILMIQKSSKHATGMSSGSVNFLTTLLHQTFHNVATPVKYQSY